MLLRQERLAAHHRAVRSCRDDVTVLFVDDELMLRQSVRPILDAHGFSWVGEAGDGLEAIALADELRPDVVVLDLLLPTLNGIDVALQIHRIHPEIGIVILTAYMDNDRVVRALKCGALGFVSKADGIDELPAAISAVASGRPYVSPAFEITSTDFLRPPSPASSMLDKLTARQRQVLQLIAEDKTNKEIAAILGLSVKTVEKHRTALMTRLDIHTAAQLVRFAIHAGLIS
jgi:DNA-binding NarL/FixJ family response regulator